MFERRAPDVVAQLLRKLVDYTSEHFADEEKLMLDTQYPDVPNHFKIHRGFIERLTALQAEFAEGKSTVSMSLMDFLKKWLIHHIGVEDQKVAAHVRSRPRAARA
jgi:hemerythrin-like metal-binding protein